MTPTAKTQGISTGSDNEWKVNYEPVGQTVEARRTGADAFPRVSWRGQQSIVDRFWARVNKTETCWLWTGTILSHGYGQISLGHPSTPGSKRWRAHRFSWELHRGTIPDGLVVCHTCDNPICVRPDHLFLGTQADNVHDSSRKGRKNAWGVQKLNADDVRVIRHQAARGLLQKDIAKAFGVARNTISGIVRRHTWAHLDAGLSGLGEGSTV